MTLFPASHRRTWYLTEAFRRLVVLTEKGQQIYDAAVGTYYPKANALAEGLSESDFKTAYRIMMALRKREC